MKLLSKDILCRVLFVNLCYAEGMEMLQNDDKSSFNILMYVKYSAFSDEWKIITINNLSDYEKNKTINKHNPNMQCSQHKICLMGI